MDPADAKAGSRNAPRDWVLLVDDHQKLRELVAEQLLALEVGVLACDSAESALQLAEIKSSPPMLALVDVMMPGMDGLALARRFIAKFGLLTKVVIMSGHVTEASWWPADLREVAFLAKPFRRADLEKLLAEARASRPAADAS